MEPAPAAAGILVSVLLPFERSARSHREPPRPHPALLVPLVAEMGFDDAIFAQSADAFENPDFVDVVIHSYRHRYGLVPGDPAVAHIETQLTAQPSITVPAITIDGIRTVSHFALRPAMPDSSPVRTSIEFADVGHNIPQERPAAWAQAVLDARDMAATA